MHSKAHTHPSIPYAVPFLVMVVLVTAVMVMPAGAQNAAPPRSWQGGTVQAFAPRLTPPGTPHVGRKLPALARPRTRRGWPLDFMDVYDNGPVNGEDLGWTINFGFSVSDSFTLGDSATVTNASFWAWLIPGDTLTSVEVQIGAAPFGNELFDQTLNFTSSNCFPNQFGYNVCAETATFIGGGVNLGAGTYWMTLSNASVPSGDPAYWDMNSGPSQAQENTIGTVPSEAFTLWGSGTTTTTTPPPQCFPENRNPQVIHDLTFQQREQPPGNGVVIDRAGNLYGTTVGAGEHASGLAFKQYRSGDGWIFDALYSFAGGYNGGFPTGVIVGPEGALYGGAQGGIESCGNNGSQYCGLVFNLTPQPATCQSTFCRWMERVPYRFNGGNDASGSINISASDQEGNLYGTSTTGGGGGCNGLGCGTVFELSPTLGGWTESILYRFTGGNDGSTPRQVLVGNDGNLYGLGYNIGYDAGVVFQLRRLGDHWIESVLHAFQGPGIDGESPSYLVQDNAGNLYGIAFWYYADSTAPIFMLEKSGAGWIFSEYFVHHGSDTMETLNNLTIDAAGNLYGTGGSDQGYRRGGSYGSPASVSFPYAYIFKASYGSGGWHYQDLAFFNYQYFDAGGPLALDAQGNLYGTTWTCGTDNAGTIWQFSP